MVDKTFGQGTQFFFGRVIDNKDPTENGRHKIRVYGVHDDETNVTDDHLPWAKSMMPTTSSSLGGYGTSPTGMLANTTVMGIWLDKNKTIPMILGSAHGNKANTEASSSSGGTEVDPSTDNDVNPLVRSTASEGGKDDLFDTNKVQEGVGKHTSTYMPSESYAGKVTYPMGWSHRTQANIEFFVNNTEGSRGVRISHPSGTLVELTDDGKIVMRAAKSMHTVADSDSTSKVDGNADSKLKGNSTSETGGDQTATVMGSKATTVTKDITTTSKEGNMTQQAQAGAMTFNGKQGMTLGAGEGDNSTSITMSPDGSLSVSGKNLTITSAEGLDIKADKLKLSGDSANFNFNSVTGLA